MKLKSKAQLFTLDLLIALIPLTIIIGVSANAFAGISSQQQWYSYFYEMQRVGNDALDVITKNAEKGMAMKAYLEEGGRVGTIEINGESVDYYLNLTEWWIPFKENVISTIAGEVKTDVIDIEAMAMYLNGTSISIGSTSAYLINTTFISSLVGDYDFRFGIIPYNRKDDGLTLSNMVTWGYFEYNLYDSDSDGMIKENESVNILPFCEYGSFEEDIVSVRRPVLFVFLEHMSMQNSTDITIPFEIDNSGYAASIVFMLRPERVNITDERISSYNITTRAYIPLTINQVYINASSEINGTLVLYVNGVEIYSGNLPADITDEIVPYLTKDIIQMQFRIYNSKPNSLGYLNMRITCSEPWVLEAIGMKPSYAVIEIGL